MAASKRNKSKRQVKNTRPEMPSILVFVYLIFMAVLFPFYLTEGYTMAGTDKSMLFRYTGLIFIFATLFFALVYWLCTDTKEKKKKPVKQNFWQKLWQKISLSDKFVYSYGIVVVLSFLFSKNKAEAVWGANGWYMGFWSQIIFVMSYFFISNFLIGEKVILMSFAISTTITFVWGVLNRFSVYPITFKGASPSFIATLGNINWFCGYWSIFFSVAAGLFYMCLIKENTMKVRILIGAYLGLSTAIGALQGSDSCMLTFLAVMLVMFCVSAKERLHRKAFYMTAAVMCLACQLMRVIRVMFPEALNYDCATTELLTGGNLTLVLLIIVAILWIVTDKIKVSDEKLLKYMKYESIVILSALVVVFVLFVALIIRNTKNPGSIGALADYSLFTFDNYWGSARGATWTAGIKVFGDMNIFEKLVGLGPDSFAYGVYREGSTAMAVAVDTFGDSRLTNAHNEWITMLVNFGLIGMVSYVGMFILKAIRYVGKGVSSPLAFACGLALIGYMCNNFFSFQQVLNAPFIFIAMGMGEAVIRKSEAGKV